MSGDTMLATALIAEDEPLLAQALQAELRALWPRLNVLAVATHGAQALQMALDELPRVMFLDIRMPGMSGMQVARALAQDWPVERAPLPLIVFISAHDQHAVDAFDQAAFDYVLKPIQTERLRRSCQRLQAALASQELSAGPQELVQQLRQLLVSAAPAPGTADDDEPLRVLQASRGNTLHLIPVGDVLYFEASHKYVRVVSTKGEHLLRMSLREMQPRLPKGMFWQVHRGTLVRADAIDTARRQDNGRHVLTLHGCADQLTVSRLYAHLFKGM